MLELKKIALRVVLCSLHPQEPGHLLAGSSKRISGSILGVSVCGLGRLWRGSPVAAGLFRIQGFDTALSCPRGRLGATRASFAHGISEAKASGLSYNLRVHAHFAGVYAEYHAFYTKLPHCCRRYKHSLSKRQQIIRPNGTKTCKALWRLAQKCPFIAHRCPICVRICGRVSTAPYFQTFFDFATFDCNGTLIYFGPWLVSGEAA